MVPGQKKPALTPDGPGADISDESKYQPTKSKRYGSSDRMREGQATPNRIGTAHTGYGGHYDDSAFGDKTSGSDYHNMNRRDSGRYGNFDQKDAAIKDLRQKAQSRGMVVENWNGNKRIGRIETGNLGGTTAYNNDAYPETWQPATSHGKPAKAPIGIGELDPPMKYKEALEINNTSDKMLKRKKGKAN